MRFYARPERASRRSRRDAGGPGGDNFVAEVVNLGAEQLSGLSGTSSVDSGPQTFSFTDPAGGVVTSFSGSASASVSRGTLSAAASGSVMNARTTSTGMSFDSIFCDANAESQDVITLVSRSGLPAGAVQFIFHATGSASANAPAGITQTALGALSLNNQDVGSLQSSGALSTPQIPVAFGQPLNVAFNLEALVGLTSTDVNFNGSFTGSGRASFAVGPPDVLAFDAAGQPLSDVTVQSAQGIVYPTAAAGTPGPAVPLPPAAWGGLACIGGIIAWQLHKDARRATRRRRRATQRPPGLRIAG